MFIIFWDFLMFYQFFFSPQVKRFMIITYKHGVYELPHKMLNDLTFRKLGNIRKIAKCSVFLLKWKFYQYLQKTVGKKKWSFSRSALFHTKTRVCLKYFANGCNKTISFAIHEHSAFFQIMVSFQFFKETVTYLS